MTSISSAGGVTRSAVRQDRPRVGPAAHPRRLSALVTARWWRDGDHETRPWTFYSPWTQKRCGREEPGVYGAQALWLAFRKAETHAGVPHVHFRAVHGFRRGVAGDVARASGDAWLGVQFIGDRDPDRIGEYVLERGDELERAVKQAVGSCVD